MFTITSAAGASRSQEEQDARPVRREDAFYPVLRYTASSGTAVSKKTRRLFIGGRVIEIR